MKRKKKQNTAPENLTLYGSSTFCGPILTDPFGSYTGRGVRPEETPVQDADDL